MYVYIYIYTYLCSYKSYVCVYKNRYNQLRQWEHRDELNASMGQATAYHHALVASQHVQWLHHFEEMHCTKSQCVCEAVQFNNFQIHRCQGCQEFAYIPNPTGRMTGVVFFSYFFIDDILNAWLRSPMFLRQHRPVKQICAYVC